MSTDEDTFLQDTVDIVCAGKRVLGKDLESKGKRRPRGLPEEDGVLYKKWLRRRRGK